eukprot:5373779-Heterocapsa_arctica.AAC.1
MGGCCVAVAAVVVIVLVLLRDDGLQLDDAESQTVALLQLDDAEVLLLKDIGSQLGVLHHVPLEELDGVVGLVVDDVGFVVDDVGLGLGVAD